MSRGGPPVTPEVAAATKVKCQCGHQRIDHCFVRNSVPKRFSLCWRCTCQTYLVGPLNRFPKHPDVIEAEPVLRYSICSDCGKSRKCIEGICDKCADALVGL